MRLGCVVYGSPEQLSGGYRYDRELLRCARIRGHTAEFISIYPGSGFDPAGLEVYDLLLIDELCHPDFIPGDGMPVCVGIVHHLTVDEELSFPSKLRHRRQERHFLQVLDAHIFNSRATRRSAEKLCGKPLEGLVVYPGREELPCRQDSPPSATDGLSILSVGNLIPRKGIHRVLMALARCAGREKNLPPWRYRIVGAESDPQYAARLRRLAGRPELAGKVEFCGRLTDSELCEAYRGADVFCLPSDYEGFGIVYLEALGAGCVGIASASGGAEEIIDSGKNGFLVSPKNIRALSNLLADLLRDSPRRKDISREARRRWKTFDSWEQSMTHGIEWLESFAAARSSPGKAPD